MVFRHLECQLGGSLAFDPRQAKGKVLFSQRRLCVVQPELVSKSEPKLANIVPFLPIDVMGNRADFLLFHKSSKRGYWRHSGNSRLCAEN